MLKRSKKSAILIGHFVADNVILPIVLYRLGKDLYIVWFKDDEKD